MAGPSSAGGTPSSLLHLLANASELPSRIGSSYHLAQEPPQGINSPSDDPVHSEALVSGKKRKAADSDDGTSAKKDKGKQPAKAVLSCQVSTRSLAVYRVDESSADMWPRGSSLFKECRRL